MPIRKTTKDFISEAKMMHGDLYDYSLVKYVNSHTNILIICHKHGVFTQMPKNHLTGSGCRKCSGILVTNTEDFIEKSKIIHFEKYDYSLTEYTNNSNKIKIICKDHGVFSQTPNDHLKGFGCHQCSGKQRSDSFSFINKAKTVHGDRYSYDSVEYVNNRSKVKIYCPTHGLFSQMPFSHLSGKGCPKCSKTGFNPSLPGYVYFLISKGGEYVKIGITNNLNNRLKRLNRATPFEFELLHYYFIDGESCKLLERYFHKKYKCANLKGFDGATEWLKYSKELMNQFIT